MKLNKIDNILVSKGVLHELCELHPAMNETQYGALKESLSLTGQQQPVISYRGKIIDGRHRMMALKELGIESAEAVELPRSTSIEDVVLFVKSSETRRHQSKTQLACHAYLSLINPKTPIKTATQAALEYGVAKRDVSYCKTIAENVGINIVESLSKGLTENICVNGVYSNYSSLRRLYDAIKRKKKDFIAKRPVKNAPIALNELRALTRTYAMNDTSEVIGLKIQLLQEYLNDRVEIE